jgi:hypothetical protein
MIPPLQSSLMPFQETSGKTAQMFFFFFQITFGFLSRGTHGVGILIPE